MCATCAGISGCPEVARSLFVAPSVRIHGGICQKSRIPERPSRFSIPNIQGTYNVVAEIDLKMHVSQDISKRDDETLPAKDKTQSPASLKIN